MTTEERLEKLERKYRRLVLAGGGLVAVLVATLLLGAASQDVKDEIRARKFVMVGEKGKVRAVLEVHEDTATAMLQVYATNGKSGLWLGVSENDRGLMVFDEKPKIRGGLVVQTDPEKKRKSSVALYLNDWKRDTTTSAAMTVSGLEFRGADGGVIWSTPNQR